MRFSRIAVAAIFTGVSAIAAHAGQAAVAVDDDNIMIRGCIAQSGHQAASAEQTLVWSRSDIMLAAAELPNAGSTGGVFYFLDDEDDLKKHVGKRVEIKGELEDFEKGEVEVKKDGDFTKIELKLDGDKEEVRVPSAWLGAAAPNRDREFDIMARRIDVENVKVLGPCNAR